MLGRLRSKTRLLAAFLFMFGTVAALHLWLPAEAPHAHRLENWLRASAFADEAMIRWSKTMTYHAWLSSRLLIFAAVILAVSFVVERRFSEVRREPKDYLTAALVQGTFLFITYVSTVLISKFLPLPQTSLLRLADGQSGLNGALWMIGSIGVYLVTLDVLLYWTHRSHHKIPLLWKFHAVHHSPTDLDCLHNYIHPVELLVRYVTIIIPLSVIIQVDHLQFFVVFSFLALQNQLNHMNVPINFGRLGCLLVDNRHHFIHHGRAPHHHNRNFAAIFSVTDRIFGTYHAPEAGPLPTTGFAISHPARLRDHVLARVDLPHRGPFPAADKRSGNPSVQSNSTMI